MKVYYPLWNWRTVPLIVYWLIDWSTQSGHELSDGTYYHAGSTAGEQTHCHINEKLDIPKASLFNEGNFGS